MKRPGVETTEGAFRRGATAPNTLLDTEEEGNSRQAFGTRRS